MERKIMKKILRFLPVVALLAGVFGVATTKSDSIRVDAAGPYKILGTFNGWSGETNTKDLTTFTTNIGGERVYYGKHTIWGEWKVHGSDVIWLGVGNLNDQAKGAGFSGTDNIISPDTTEPGSEYTFFLYETGNRINVIKDVYLAGSANNWTTGDATRKFTQDPTKPWMYSLDTSLAAAEAFKVNFGGWDGALGHYNMTSVSANYGFVSSGDPDHNIVAGTGFYAGNYTITLDIVNYLVDISPKASTMAAEINSYPGGDISTPECATKYAAIKPKVTNLSDSEKTIFETSSDVDIANARARYTQWATANNDLAGMYTPPSVSGRIYSVNQQNNRALITLIGLLGFTAIAGFYFLKTKKQ